MIANGQKIGAIKRYREETGAGLKEAIVFIEAIESGNTPAASLEDISDHVTQKILGLLQSNKKIEAIKVYRELKGVGLKEAKDAVEALGEQHGIKSAAAGCAGMVIIAMLGSLACLAVSLN